MKTAEDFKKEMQSIPNNKLAEMAHAAISKLCQHGDRAFTMTVPPQTDDTDMILSEIVTRFESQLQSKEESKPDEIENQMKREDGYYWVNLQGSWMICHYTNLHKRGIWNMTGVDDDLQDSEFREIDENKLIRG